MVESHFQTILKEFEPYFKCPLNAEGKETCIVQMALGIQVQIELNRYGKILIGCRLGHLVGRHRDLLFAEALKANAYYPISTGTFGFSRKSQNLILFMTVEPNQLKAATIDALMTPFAAKAKIWADAIKNGSIPPVGESKAAKTDNPFGLKR